MESRFSLRDFVLIGLLVVVIVMIAVAMLQFDRQWGSVQAIRDKLAAITDFDGVLGHFGWSADRDAAIQPKVLIGDSNSKVFVAAPN